MIINIMRKLNSSNLWLVFWNVLWQESGCKRTFLSVDTRSAVSLFPSHFTVFTFLWYMVLSSGLYFMQSIPHPHPHPHQQANALKIHYLNLCTWNKNINLSTTSFIVHFRAIGHLTVQFQKFPFTSIILMMMMMMIIIIIIIIYSFLLY
jgi:hypothetical protein